MTTSPPWRGQDDAVTVRRAQERDEPALARIDVVTWTSAVSPAPPPADAGSHVFFSDRTPPDAVLVAEVDASVVGWVKLQPVTAMPSHAHVWEIAGLAVDPSAQGTGVGRHLVEAAAQQCRRRGARKLTLRVLGPNAVARRLYDRCGFVVEGVLRGEFLLDGRYVDDVLMARHLAPPDPAARAAP